MSGVYYTSRDDSLFIVPQLYIEQKSDHVPKSGSIIQMYAQLNLNSINKTATNDEDEIVTDEKDFESWACNMKIFDEDDESDLLYEDKVDVSFYKGSGEIGSLSGTYSGVNSVDKVDNSPWENSASLTEKTLSEKNHVGQKFNIYQCGMFRKLEDGEMELKVRDTIEWQYGYKLYTSKGDFDVQ